MKPSLLFTLLILVGALNIQGPKTPLEAAPVHTASVGAHTQRKPFFSLNVLDISYAHTQKRIYDAIQRNNFHKIPVDSQGQPKVDFFDEAFIENILAKNEQTPIEVLNLAGNWLSGQSLPLLKKLLEHLTQLKVANLTDLDIDAESMGDLLLSETCQKLDYTLTLNFQVLHQFYKKWGPEWQKVISDLFPKSQEQKRLSSQIKASWNHPWWTAEKALLPLTKLIWLPRGNIESTKDIPPALMPYWASHRKYYDWTDLQWNPLEYRRLVSLHWEQVFPESGYPRAEVQKAIEEVCQKEKRLSPMERAYPGQALCHYYYRWVHQNAQEKARAQEPQPYDPDASNFAPAQWETTPLITPPQTSLAQLPTCPADCKYCQDPKATRERTALKWSHKMIQQVAQIGHDYYRGPYTNYRKANQWLCWAATYHFNQIAIEVEKVKRRYLALKPSAEIYLKIWRNLKCLEYLYVRHLLTDHEVPAYLRSEMNASSFWRDHLYKINPEGSHLLARLLGLVEEPDTPKKKKDQDSDDNADSDPES